MTKIPTVDMGHLPAHGIRHSLARARLPSRGLCQDPAAVALSLERRLGGFQPRRARANAALSHRVATAWLDYAAKRTSSCIPISIEDFTTDPEWHVRQILGLSPDEVMPQPIPRSGNAEQVEDAWLPDRRMHLERRHIQSNSPVYQVTRDNWMQGIDSDVLSVLRDIRRAYGTSPRFRVFATVDRTARLAPLHESPDKLEVKVDRFPFREVHGAVLQQTRVNRLVQGLRNSVRQGLGVTDPREWAQPAIEHYLPRAARTVCANNWCAAGHRFDENVAEPLACRRHREHIGSGHVGDRIVPKTSERGLGCESRVPAPVPRGTHRSGPSPIRTSATRRCCAKTVIARSKVPTSLAFTRRPTIPQRRANGSLKQSNST